MLRGEATNTNVIVFGLIRLGLEPTIYHTRGENVSHCASDAVSFEENTHNDVKSIIKDILKIEEDVPLQVADRLRKRRDGRPRSIIAKFEHRKDSGRV